MKMINTKEYITLKCKYYKSKEDDKRKEDKPNIIRVVSEEFLKQLDKNHILYSIKINNHIVNITHTCTNAYQFLHDGINDVEIKVKTNVLRSMFVRCVNLIDVTIIPSENTIPPEKETYELMYTFRGCEN